MTTPTPAELDDKHLSLICELNLVGQAVWNATRLHGVGATAKLVPLVRNLEVLARDYLAAVEAANGAAGQGGGK